MDNKKTRYEEIHNKGFDLFGNKQTLQNIEQEEDPLAYRKINVGVKKLEDAILNFGAYNGGMTSIGPVSKSMIIRALATKNLPELR